MRAHILNAYSQSIIIPAQWVFLYLGRDVTAFTCRKFTDAFTLSFSPPMSNSVVRAHRNPPSPPEC